MNMLVAELRATAANVSLCVPELITEKLNTAADEIELLRCKLESREAMLNDLKAGIQYAIDQLEKMEAPDDPVLKALNLLHSLTEEKEAK